MRDSNWKWNKYGALLPFYGGLIKELKIEERKKMKKKKKKLAGTRSRVCARLALWRGLWMGLSACVCVCDVTCKRAERESGDDVNHRLDGHKTGGVSRPARFIHRERREKRWCTVWHKSLQCENHVFSPLSPLLCPKHRPAIFHISDSSFIKSASSSAQKQGKTRRRRRRQF